MSSNVIITWTKGNGYTYEELKALQLISGSPEMQYNYSGWGKNRTAIDVKGLEDKLTVSDKYTIDVTKTVKEDLIKIADEDDLKAGSTVLYDFEIDNFSSSRDVFEEFALKRTPLGYSELRPLVPGEYEYKEAIVGVQMQIAQTQGRFGLIGQKLTIDVEDVIQKGRVTCSSSGPTTVLLSKKYYTIPHITSALVESDGYGVIEVSEVSRDSFKIGIKSLTNTSVYVNGTIDYLADGY